MSDINNQGKTIRDVCDLPIDVRAMRGLKLDMCIDAYQCIEGKKVIPTQFSVIDSKGFIALLELAGAIYSGLDWNKKGRIVLEYDPQESKFVLATFQEATDLNIDPDHEEVPRFLLRREDR